MDAYQLTGGTQFGSQATLCESPANSNAANHFYKLKLKYIFWCKNYAQCGNNSILQYYSDK